MTSMTYRILKTSRFKNLYSWSVLNATPAELNFSDKYNRVKIGSLLRKSKNTIIINDDKTYKRVTVKLYGGGVKLRDEVLGKEIKTKRQFVLKEGQFLYSRIDARNGAFGLASKEVDNAIVSNEFPIYDVDTSLVIPEFLVLITSSKPFYDFCQSLSSGSTGRQRIDENSFLSFKVPLPDISIQTRIVEQHKYNITTAQKAENEANELKKQIEKYLFSELGIEKPKTVKKKEGLQFVRFKDLSRWGIEFLQINDEVSLFSKKFNNVSLQDYIIINPKIDFKSLQKEDEITFIPMEVVSDEYGQIKEYRTTKVQNAKGYTKIEEDDLIWAKITPCMENGKSAIAKNLKNGFACGSTEFHVFRAKNESIRIDFIYTLFRSEYLKSIAKRHFTGSAGQQRVPAQFFKSLKIPLPPRVYTEDGIIDTNNDIQTQIVNHITIQKEKIKSLHQQAEELRKQAKETFENEIFA